METLFKVGATVVPAPFFKEILERRDVMFKSAVVLAIEPCGLKEDGHCGVVGCPGKLILTETLQKCFGYGMQGYGLIQK